MSSSDDNTNGTDDTGGDGRDAAAVRRADAGTGGWEDAVRLQRWATPDHADFYALAGEMVATLRALDDLAQLLHRQVAGYARTQQDRGRWLYDDTREVDPAERLQTAVIALQELRSGASRAADRANTFWSAIGHIGTEEAR
jgi:hypothetical protein